MISHIEGILESNDISSIIVDVNGIGYEITVTGSVLRNLPKKGEKIKVLTYLNVREDLMQLFGFSNKEGNSTACRGNKGGQASGQAHDAAGFNHVARFYSLHSRTNSNRAIGK